MKNDKLDLAELTERAAKGDALSQYRLGCCYMYGSCPYCRQDLEQGVCEHWVASLNDDGDGCDTVTPLYFAWTDYCGQIHEEMITSMDEYFEVSCGLCKRVVQKGVEEGDRVLRTTNHLPSIERAILQEAIKLLDQADAEENHETVCDLLGRSEQQIKDRFAEFVLQCGGKAKNWEILNPPPAPSWSGTNYWAEDAEKCIRCIIQESRKATDRLQKLVQKG